MKQIADVLLPWAKTHEPKLADMATRARGTNRLRMLAALFTLRAERDRGMWLFELFEECEPSELIDLMLFKRKDGQRVGLWLRGLIGYPPDGMSDGAWIGALQAAAGMRGFPAAQVEMPANIRPQSPPEPAAAAAEPVPVAAKAAGLFGGAA